MAEKKPTAKKATPKKAAPKKSVQKKVAPKAASSVRPTVDKLTNHSWKNAFRWQVIAIFLFAVIAGNVISGSFLGTFSEISLKDLSPSAQVKFSNDSEFIVHDDKTWISVPGTPMELIVLNDKTCGQACDPTQTIGSLRQGVTPALLVRHVDVASPEGQKFMTTFEIKGVPSFIFGEGANKFTRDGQRFVDKAQDVLIEKDGFYLADSAKTGFKYGKFITPPSFDKTNEPELGTGPVTVVEFTDLQCPFCKRLHDQNKDLIDRLISEDKITYVVKDFPLGFHPQANIMHAIGNCVYKNGGEAQYFGYKNNVFDNQDKWSGNEDAKYLALKYAEQAGANTDSLLSCANSEEIQAEIQADAVEGGQYGVTGTPALFIGTQIMPGAIGADSFEAAVNAELAKMGIVTEEEVEESNEDDTEE